MRILIVCTLCVFITLDSAGQSIGIGTTTPNTNAILDLTATNKGFLLPRLTASQRTALTDIAGMVVYDSTLKRMYYSNGSGWQYFIDNGYWSPSGTAIYNLNQVAIGTITPHASARLQVNSTTQGFLPPSMTSTQRISISSPAEGLMVFDNTVDRLYQYQSGTWKTMLNNDYWAMNGTDLYNSSAEVGIGNASPSERLHVSGNIRADGDLVSYGEVKINNVEGILQFQNGSTDKTFVQLSGENLRMGTNSGNTNGNIVFRLNGVDRMYFTPEGNMIVPGGYIQAGGDLKLTSGAATRSITGTADLLPIAYGRVSSAGVLLSGTSNVTTSRISEGIYHLNCPAFNAATTIIVTMNVYIGGFYAYPNVEHWTASGPTVYRVPFYNITASAYRDAGFSFVAYR
jgi:hypothetical protein